MQKIVTSLFFDGKAEEAVNHYADAIKDTTIGTITHYRRDNSPMPKGTVMAVEFQIAGQNFLAMNGPQMCAFTPAISITVNCETQEEIDHVWDRLSAGGEQQVCGRLKDKFGVFWQVVPSKMGEWMRAASDQQLQSMIGAMMQMTKIDMNALKQAYELK